MDTSWQEKRGEEPQWGSDTLGRPPKREEAAQKLSTAMHTLFVDCMVFRCSLLPMELRDVFVAQMESQWTEEGQAGLFERIRRRLARLSPKPCTEAEAQASVDTLIKKIRRIDGRLLRDWVR